MHYYFYLYYYYYYYFYYDYLTRYSPMDSISLRLNSQLSSLGLSSLPGITDSALRYDFLQPLDVFSSLSIIISKFTQNSRQDIFN